MRYPRDYEEREAREAFSAYRDFKAEQIRRAGIPWHTLTASFEAARLVQRAFFAGWRGRKIADLKTGYGGEYQPMAYRLESAEALIRAFLADGPRSSSAVRAMAEAANVRGAILYHAANAVGVRRSKSGAIWIWSLPTIEEELADTGLFFDAGIPIG